MVVRASKCALLFAVGLFYLLVVFNNLTDYGSNYQFVHHVLMMDSTFPGNSGMWRAINSTWVHHAFYDSIIAWEMVTTVLALWGAARMAGSLRGPAAEFNVAKRLGVAALTLSLLMWLVAFLSVGAEWFLMWQSKTWNGQDAAFRMFTVIGITLLFVIQPETAVTTKS
jgi:predicted small integral membrane protein